MKLIYITILLSMLIRFDNPVATVNEGYRSDNNKKDVCYCAILLNGKIKLVVDGKQVYTDVKLALGRKITPEGVLIYPNGGKLFLKNGECVNHDGELVETDFKKTKSANISKKFKLL